MGTHYHIYLQLAVLILGMSFLKGLRKYRMGWLLALIFLDVSTEIVFPILRSMGVISNYWLLNLYVLLSTPLYFLVFFRMIPVPKRFRKLYIGVAFWLQMLLLANYFFFEGISNLNRLSIVFQQLVVILLSSALLFKLATQQKYIVLTQHPAFWVSAGLLLFSLGTLIVMGMSQYILVNHLTIRNETLNRILMPMLLVILYLSYSYAFYLCRPKKKSYSPSL